MPPARLPESFYSTLAAPASKNSICRSCFHQKIRRYFEIAACLSSVRYVVVGHSKPCIKILQELKVTAPTEASSCRGPTLPVKSASGAIAASDGKFGGSSAIVQSSDLTVRSPHLELNFVWSRVNASKHKLCQLDEQVCRFGKAPTVDKVSLRPTKVTPVGRKHGNQETVSP